MPSTCGWDDGVREFVAGEGLVGDEATEVLALAERARGALAGWDEATAETKAQWNPVVRGWCDAILRAEIEQLHAVAPRLDDVTLRAWIDALRRLVKAAGYMVAMAALEHVRAMAAREAAELAL